MSYVHLRVRSGFSLMNSTITIEKLVAKAKEMNFSALALTDEQVLYGAIPFYKACIKANIKPIIGMIVNILDENGIKQSEIVLLAKNNAGYKNLIGLSSYLQVESLPGIALEKLSAYTDDLIGILPADDPVLQHKLEGEPFAQVQQYIKQYEELFQEKDFYIGAESNRRAENLIKNYAETYETQITAISDVRYLEEKDVYSYDCLLSMKNGQEWNMQLSDSDLKGKYLRNEQEVKASAGEIFDDAIEETSAIAAKCEVHFDFTKRLLPTFPLEAGMDADHYLEKLCREKLPQKYMEVTDEIKERLEYELKTIQSMQFSDYFLITADIISYAKKNGIMVGPGRGSSAGSLVAYVLGITDVDPMRYQLIFERFLNPERQTMPDIDIDFSDERRDEVLAYVLEKYGKEHVAQIITFGTFAARSLIRELIKTMAVEQQDARFILNEIPLQSSKGLVEIIQDSPELRDYIKQSSKLKLLFSIAVRLEGIPRNISTHAAGVVISEDPLTDHLPLTSGAGEIYLTQYAMNDLEAIGLLKMDFLGLRNLSLIERVVKSIRYNGNRKFTLNSIPEDDELTYQMLREGRTNGVFQLESRGMKRVLKELQPTGFEDIVAVNALFRPGPMDFIPNYIARKHNREAVVYPHKDLQPILENTYGVLVYQEQILQIANRIAHFSLGEADVLRRAVSKKNQQVMDEQKASFIQGCIENGYDEQVAEEIFSWIVRFSNYGFPRSHAVAYSKISYQLAYLKAHYPAEFFSEILSGARSQQEKINLYYKEMRDIHLELYPPSINKSYGKHTVENGNVRMGLYAIKGMGGDVVKEIITVRKKGPFTSLSDFCLRVSSKVVRRANIENLILAGCFDELERNRASLLASIDQALEQAELFSDFHGQENLFQGQVQFVERYVDMEDFTIIKKLQDEKELLGMYISSHPLESYRNRLRAAGYVPFSDADRLIGRRNTKSAAIVQEIKQIRTKRGDQMAFLTLADESMTMEAVLFPDRYRALKNMLEEERIILFKGKIEKRNDSLQWIIDDAKQLADDELNEESDKVLFIKSTSETNRNALQVIAALVKEHPGNTPIILYDDEKKQSYKLSVDYYLNPNGYVLNQLSAFFGRKHVVIQRRPQ